MTLKEIYEYTLATPKDTDIDILSAGAGLPFWEVLKKQVLEPKIIAMLSLQDDYQKVMDGEENLEQYGRKAIIARTVADNLQQIIYLVERNHEEKLGK